MDSHRVLFEFRRFGEPLRISLLRQPNSLHSDRVGVLQRLHSARRQFRASRLLSLAGVPRTLLRGRRAFWQARRDHCDRRICFQHLHRDFHGVGLSERSRHCLCAAWALAGVGATPHNVRPCTLGCGWIPVGDRGHEQSPRFARHPAVLPDGAVPRRVFLGRIGKAGGPDPDRGRPDARNFWNRVKMALRQFLVSGSPDRAYPSRNKYPRLSLQHVGERIRLDSGCLS